MKNVLIFWKKILDKKFKAQTFIEVFCRYFSDFNFSVAEGNSRMKLGWCLSQWIPTLPKFLESILTRILGIWSRSSRNKETSHSSFKTMSQNHQHRKCQIFRLLGNDIWISSTFYSLEDLFWTTKIRFSRHKSFENSNCKQLSTIVWNLGWVFA